MASRLWCLITLFLASALPQFSSASILVDKEAAPRPCKPLVIEVAIGGSRTSFGVGCDLDGLPYKYMTQTALSDDRTGSEEVTVSAIDYPEERSQLDGVIFNLIINGVSDKMARVLITQINPRLRRAYTITNAVEKHELLEKTRELLKRRLLETDMPKTFLE